MPKFYFAHFQQEGSLIMIYLWTIKCIMGKWQTTFIL